MGGLLRGFRDARPVSRASFGILSSASLTISVSRGVNYLRERNRRFPRLRSVVRRVRQAQGGGGLRVHHFLPGILVSTVAGAAAIASRKDGKEFVLSLPFGAGLGLTMDEIALLVELDNPYWRSEKLALLQAGVAGLGAAGLGAQFLRGAPGRDGD